MKLGKVDSRATRQLWKKNLLGFHAQNSTARVSFIQLYFRCFDVGRLDHDIADGSTRFGPDLK